MELNIKKKIVMTVMIIVAVSMLLGCTVTTTVNQKVTLTEPLAGDSIFKAELVNTVTTTTYAPLETDTEWVLNFTNVPTGTATLKVTTNYGQVYEIPIDVQGTPITVSLSSIKSSRLQ